MRRSRAFPSAVAILPQQVRMTTPSIHLRKSIRLTLTLALSLFYLYSPIQSRLLLRRGSVAR